MADDWLIPLIAVVGVAATALVAWYIGIYSAQVSSISNTETWDLIEDDKGNLKRIVVHRKVVKNE